MIHLLPGIAIPEDELRFAASRSGGPGGQNVNKVSSRVTLTFDLKASTTLSDEHKRKIRETIGGRINKDGVLRIVSQRTRSQELNRSDAIERFSAKPLPTLGKEAAERVAQQHAWPRVFERLFCIYRETCANYKQQPAK